MKRLVVVVVVAVAGFAAAIVAFGDAARSNCVADATSARGYAAEFPDHVRAGEGEHVVRLTRAGLPLTGAWVCVSLAPASTGGPGAAAQGRELGAGRYAVSLELTRAGEWSGVVLVAEDGGDPEVAVPVTVDVTR